MARCECCGHIVLPTNTEETERFQRELACQFDFNSPLRTNCVAITELYHQFGVTANKAAFRSALQVMLNVPGSTRMKVNGSVNRMYGMPPTTTTTTEDFL